MRRSRSSSHASHRPSARRRRAGQATVEYVILVALLIVALTVIFGAFPDVIAQRCLSILVVLGLPII